MVSSRLDGRMILSSVGCSMNGGKQTSDDLISIKKRAVVNVKKAKPLSKQMHQKLSDRKKKKNLSTPPLFPAELSSRLPRISKGQVFPPGNSRTHSWPRQYLYDCYLQANSDPFLQLYLETCQYPPFPKKKTVVAVRISSTSVSTYSFYLLYPLM